jgi:hypothetical protein
MTPLEMKSAIITRLESGSTVTITNGRGGVKITPRNWRSWKKSGFELLKIEGAHLCVARGNRYDSILGCQILFS